MKVLEIRVGAAADALDRFEAAWNRRLEGRPVRTLHVLTLPNLPQVAKSLSPARWALLEALRGTARCRSTSWPAICSATTRTCIRM